MTDHVYLLQGALALLYFSYGALGVIYGDIGTSPLYTLQSCLAYETGGSTERTSLPLPEHLLAVASLLFWSLTLVVIMKYVFIILRFNDNGEGEDGWPGRGGGIERYTGRVVVPPN